MHRCLQRHGVGRLPDIEGDKPTKKPFKACPTGFFHIDIVIMDNLSSLKGRRVPEMIEAAGADLSYLPPSLQPTLQSHRGCLRQAQGAAENGRRTNLGGLWDAVGRILDLFPPAECANDFSAAGYDAT